jgi:threonine/homoserine/homoserine lactone efflux protein
MAVCFALACLPSCALWCGFGVAIGRWLESPRALRAFNLSMAALLAASVVALFV